MFATNQMVAEYSGFPNVYEAFKRAEIYRGIGYKQLNSELLSHDIIHLGRVQAICTLHFSAHFSINSLTFSPEP